MTFNFAPPLYIMITKFLLLLSTSIEYNQWLDDVLYKFSSLDNYRDSIHYRDSFTTTIVIVKFLLSLSTIKNNLLLIFCQAPKKMKIFSHFHAKLYNSEFFSYSSSLSKMLVVSINSLVLKQVIYYIWKCPFIVSVMPVRHNLYSRINSTLILFILRSKLTMYLTQLASVCWQSATWFVKNYCSVA